MEMKKIATRDSYGNALKELGAEYSNLVVLDADLAGATKTGTFQKVYPDRHFDCGIAEANMICVAAGMSTTGLVPFASSFAMFGATHGGISVGEDGASHQCCEDFALMRSIPGMTVICPADDVEARAAVRAAYHHNGPVYLRFGRLAVPVIHEEGYNFQIGKGEVLRDGSDIAIIANGLLVYEAVVAAKELAKEGINAMVINMATVKPLDEELIPEAAKKCGKVITCEEHSVIGGMGEAVTSLLAKKHPTRVECIGVNDEFGHSGKAEDLLKQFGLTAENIVKTAKMLCAE